MKPFKKLFFSLIIIIILVFIGCKKKDDPHDVIIIEDKICGVEDPATELPWLAQIISVAKTDISPDYFGTIYLISEEEKETFWINMNMEQEQLNGHWFDCEGGSFEVNQDTVIPWPGPTKIIYAKYQADLVWDYPIKPGSEEWNEFGNYEQRVAALQIPYNVLSKLNTAFLIEVCLNYPFVNNIFLFNSVQAGIDNLKQNFKAFSEFLLRLEAGKFLFEKYKMIKPGDFNESWSSFEKIDFAFKLEYIEIFLAQPELLSTFTKNEKKELVSYLLSNIEEKNKYPEVFVSNNESIGFCLIRILEQEGALTDIPANVNYDDLIYFLETGFLRDYELLNSIILLAENYQW